MKKRRMHWKRNAALLLAFLLAGGATGLFTLAEEPAAASTLPVGEAMPAVSGYQPVVENGRLSLAVDTAEGRILVTDGSVDWTSTPAGYDEDPLARGGTKIAMESLIQIEYTDRLGNVSAVNGQAASVNQEGLSCQKIEDGVLLTFRFPKEGFTIPVEITLDGDALDVSVRLDGVEETNESYQLTSISLLPYFGAAPADADGYLFVPDGSGALIEWKKADATAADYRQYVYGREPTTTKMQIDALEETAYLPVFGLKNGEAAMLGIITEGAGRAAVNASVSGKRCSYSNVFAQFLYRDSEMVTIAQKNQTVRVLEQTPPDAERFSVRYLFLQGEEANYVGMAHRYGEWLMRDQPEKQASGTVPLYMELPGGVMTQQSFLGFPVDRVTALTTYEDVETITARLQELGVEEMTIHYRWWNKDGDGAAIPTGVQPEGQLGGKEAFRRTLSALQDAGIPLYLDFNFTDLVKDRWGFRRMSDSAASMRKNPSLQFSYTLQDHKAITTESYTLLRLTGIRKAVDKVIAAAEDEAFTGFAPVTLGQKLYSDFSGKSVRRDTADREWAAVLESLQQAKGKQLLSAACGYALPYADVVTDTPMYTSGYSIETAGVPFYQIALHEYVDMSTPSLNQMSEPRQGLLQALETGVGIKFQFLYRLPEEALDAGDASLLGSLFDDWVEEAVALYQEAGPILSRVAGCRIVSHTLLTEEVRETVFDNGVRIYVNYGDADYANGSVVVEAGGYAVI